MAEKERDQMEGGKELGKPEQRMEGHGNRKGPKSTNHREHDKFLHQAMPDEHKGDCGY